jgi:hypothetical protein
MFDAVRRAWDIPDYEKILDRPAKRIGRVVSVLLKAGATPTDVRERANRMRHAKPYLKGKIDPDTLEQNWSSFAESDR